MADKILTALVPRIQGAMGEATEMQCARTRELLGVQYPPASLPGEHPHRREGYLQEGVDHGQETTTEAITETVSFSRENGNPGVPHFLEEGTDTMAERPFVKPMIDRIRREYLPAVAERIEI